MTTPEKHILLDNTGSFVTLPHQIIGAVPAELPTKVDYVDKTGALIIPKKTIYFDIDAGTSQGGKEHATSLEEQNETIIQLSEDWLNLMQAWQTGELASLQTTFLIGKSNKQMERAAMLAGFTPVFRANKKRRANVPDRLVFDLRWLDNPNFYAKADHACRVAIEIAQNNKKL